LGLLFFLCCSNKQKIYIQQNIMDTSFITIIICIIVGILSANYIKNSFKE